MNKLLKLTGVSILAVMAASGANAAGYTCEELIEYTSCNDGYYLNAGDCIEGSTCGAGNYLKPSCASGYIYLEGLCYDGEFWYDNESEESCAETDGETWYGSGCIDEESWEFSTGDESVFIAATYTCTACSSGTYQSAAGQYSCITCPAGSECPTTTAATLCESGEYSNAGATACSTCYPYSYTNASGQSVTVPATSDAGATGITACYISPDAYFTDVTGTYHFTEKCVYDDISYSDLTTIVINSEEECVAIGEEWGDVEGWCYVEDISKYITSESECAEVATKLGYNNIEWTNNKCLCAGMEYWFLDSNGLNCEW